jgi:hypothetical protein
VTGGDDLVGMSDGGPVGAQYVGGGLVGSTKLLVGQPLELREHMAALTVEAVKQQVTLRRCVDGHTEDLRPYASMAGWSGCTSTSG